MPSGIVDLPWSSVSQVTKSIESVTENFKSSKCHVTEKIEYRNGRSSVNSNCSNELHDDFFQFRLLGEGNDHCVVSIANTGFVLRIKKVAVDITTGALPNNYSKTTPRQETCDKALPLTKIINYGPQNCLDIKKKLRTTKSPRRKSAHSIASPLLQPLQNPTSSQSAFITYHSPFISPQYPPSSLSQPAISNRSSPPHQRKCLRQLLIQQCSRDLAFLNNVALSIFGPLLVKPGRLVCLSPQQLQVIQSQIQHTREEGRRHKTINPFGIAVMCADASTTFQSRSAHDLFTIDLERKEFMHGQRFDDEDGLEANIKEANSLMASLNRDRSASSFQKSGTSVCTQDSMTEIENCSGVASLSHSSPYADKMHQSSHGENTPDGNYIGGGCFCCKGSCHGAKRRKGSQKSNYHAEDEVTSNVIDGGCQELNCVSCAGVTDVASTNSITGCAAPEDAAIQSYFLQENLIDVQAKKRKEKLKLCQLLFVELGQLATVTCKSLHASIAGEMFGNGKINYHTAQNIESYFNSMHVSSENNSFKNLLTILGNLLQKDDCSGVTKGIESGLITALNSNSAMFPDMLPLPPTSVTFPPITGTLPHIHGALPHTPGALLQTPGALPQTSGALPHTSGSLTHTPSALLHTSGALPHITGTLPPITGGTLPNITGAPFPTSEAPLPTTKAPLLTTEAALPATEAPLPTSEAPLPTTETPLSTTQASHLFHSPMMVCVELKPKQGFLEPIEGGSMQLCRFCLKQYLKCDSGAVSQRSRYCPLELFSGNERRMSYAVRELFAAPQNNLRIFADGILVENVMQYIHLCDVIPKVLLYRPYGDHLHASAAEASHSSIATTLPPNDQDDGHPNPQTSQNFSQAPALQHCDHYNTDSPILEFDETNLCGWDGRCSKWSGISCSTIAGLCDRAYGVTSVSVGGVCSNPNRDIDSGNNSDCDVDEPFEFTLANVQPKGSSSSVVSQEVTTNIVGAATLPSKLSSDSLFSSYSESSILETTPCTADFSLIGRAAWSNRAKSWDEVASSLDEGLIEVVRRRPAPSQDAYHHPLCSPLKDKFDRSPQSSHTVLNGGQETRPHIKSSLDNCSSRCCLECSCGGSCRPLLDRTTTDTDLPPLQNGHSNPITDCGLLRSASTIIPSLTSCSSAQRSPEEAAHTLNPNSILGKVLSSQQSRLSVVGAWEAYNRLVALVGQVTADDFLNAGSGVQMVEEEGCVGVLQCLRDWGWTGEYHDQASQRVYSLSNTKMCFGDASTDFSMSRDGTWSTPRHSQDSLSRGNLELYCQQPLSPSNNRDVGLNSPHRCSSCGYDQGDCLILPSSLSDGSDMLPQGNSGQTPESHNLKCDYCEQMLYVKGVKSCVLSNNLDISKDASLGSAGASLDCIEKSSPHSSSNSSTSVDESTVELAPKCLVTKPSPVSAITCYKKDHRHQCVDSQLGGKSLSLCDSTSTCERFGPSFCHGDVQALVDCALTMGYDEGVPANESPIRNDEVRSGGCQRTRGAAVESLVLDLQEFLQGLTFKDCSLMLLLSGPHPCPLDVRGSFGGSSKVEETSSSPTCTFATIDTSQNNSAYASKSAQISSNLGPSTTISYREMSPMDLPTLESVSLSPSPSLSSPFWVETDMGWFLCQVTVIDLVSKSPSKVSHHDEGVRKLASLVRVKLAAGDLLPTCCRVAATGDGDTWA